MIRAIPYIATYYKTGDDPVAQVDDRLQRRVRMENLPVGTRRTTLNLGGGGTRKIAFSRPLVIVGPGPNPRVHVVFRDADRGDRISMGTTTDITGAAPANGTYQT